MHPERPAERSVAQVLADVAGNLQDILSAQIRLAQVEARAELRTFRAAGVLLLSAVLGGLLSAFFLLQAVVAALSLVMSVWLAALIVAVAMALTCVILLQLGVNLMRRRAAAIAADVKERARCTVQPSK